MNPILSDAIAVILCLVMSFMWVALISVPFAVSIPETSRAGKIISTVTWLVFAGGGVAFFMVYVLTHLWR